MAGIAEMAKISAARPARNRPAPTRRPARFQVAADASAGIAAVQVIRLLIVFDCLCFCKLSNCDCLEVVRTLT